MSIFTQTLALLSDRPRPVSLADVPRWPDWLQADDAIARCARGRAFDVLSHGTMVPVAVAVANGGLWTDDGELAPAFVVHPGLGDPATVDAELLWNVATRLTPPNADDEPTVDPVEQALRRALGDGQSRTVSLPIPMARTHGERLFLSVTLVDALLLPTRSVRGRLIPAALSPKAPPVLAPKAWWARDWVEAYELLAAV